MIRRPLLTPGQRATLHRVCAAMYGFAVGASLLPVALRPKREGQMAGYMASQGYDASSSWYFLSGVVVLTLATPLVLRPVLRALNAPDTQRWARNLATIALIVPLWSVSLQRLWTWVLIPSAIALAATVILRRVPMRFTQRDAILLPSALAIFVALADRTVQPVHHILILSAGAVTAIRLLLPFIRRHGGIDPSLCFALAPVALFAQSHVFARDQRYAGWPYVVWVVLTPVLLRLLVPDGRAARRCLALAIVWLVYPLAIFGYSSATSLFTAEGRVRVSFFEAAQHVVAASEMLEGEELYRDIIPPHGMIQDGLLDYVILRVTDNGSIGQILKIRGVMSAIALFAIYAIAIAVTGSPHIALTILFAGFGLGIASVWIRFFPALAGLALLAFALRTRRLVLLGVTGALVVVATLMTVDQGAYLFTILMVMLLRFPDRKAAFRIAAIGALITGTVAMAWMAAVGIADDFFRVTILEVLTVGPAYALDPVSIPETMQRFFPEVVMAAIDSRSIHYIVWLAILMVLAAFAVRERRPPRWRRRFTDPLLAVCIYTLIMGIAYAERQHVYFANLTPAIVLGAAWWLWRRRDTTARVAAIVLAAVMFLAVNATVHFGIATWLRRTRGPIDSTLVEIDLPRARGGLFRQPDAQTFHSIRRYVESRLAPDETFFDFTNRGLSYFLLRRDCPVRQIEVAFYESDRLQQEVIAAIENNPKVRAAMVPPDENDLTGVDGVSNRMRAPLVWKYLQEEFEPDWNEDGVVIWKRRDAR